MTKKVKPLKLSIACGQNIPEGFVGMDIADLPGIKYVGDALDFSKHGPWATIKDNSVDEIDCTMFVEHIPHTQPMSLMIPILEAVDNFQDFKTRMLEVLYPGDGFLRFFEELYRVLKPAEFADDNPNQPIRGFVKAVTPYYSSPRADQDPTHVRRMCEASYLYLNQEWLKANKLDHYPIKADFNFSYAYNLNGRLQNRNQEFVSNAVLTELNAADDLIVTLIKK